MYETATIDCPYCGSPTEITVDRSVGSHSFVEDCMVCCSPILVGLACDEVTGELTRVAGEREND